MENNDRTLKELATPDVLEPAQTYELKSSLIHLLPKFHGLAGEDPHKHLKEFHVVYSTMRPQGIPEDYIKMKVFPFSLDGAVKDWFSFRHPELHPFGKKVGIRQHTGETLHEYWERFNKLYATCPHHQISEQLLIQYFYEGLLMTDRSMIDIARRSIDGQDTSSNKASDLQHGKPHATIWNNLLLDNINPPWQQKYV
ncbi:hypothetical protein CR513_49134, partial [Mucuna pruriens]